MTEKCTCLNDSCVSEDDWKDCMFIVEESYLKLDKCPFLKEEESKA